jgi:hypothetical protein
MFLLLYIIGMTINMKYQVHYLKPKKKMYSRQVVTFYKIEDAGFWEQIVKQQGCKEIEIVPLFEVAHC